MNSYASIDGLPCAGSPTILTDLLREELGFQGAVVADYWAVFQLLSFHHAWPPDAGEAAIGAVGRARHGASGDGFLWRATQSRG